MPDGFFNRAAVGLTDRHQPAIDHQIEFSQLLDHARRIEGWDKDEAGRFERRFTAFCRETRFNRPDGPWASPQIEAQLRITAHESQSELVRYTLCKWALPIIEKHPALQQQALGDWRAIGAQQSSIAATVRSFENMLLGHKAQPWRETFAARKAAMPIWMNGSAPG